MRRFINPMTMVLLAMMFISTMMSGRFSNPMDWLMNTMLKLPAIVIALSFHEFAHAVVAYKLGDMTPKLQGRVTINPMAHVDPIGLICLLFVGFGWGQPVQINARNFKKQRRDTILVSVAGVTMNLIVAIISAMILGILVKTGVTYSYMGTVVQDILIYMIQINLVLMFFNLLPIPPLDGFNIITEAFRLYNTKFYYMIYDKGMFILLFCILFNITDIIIPMVNGVYMLLLNIFI